MPSRLQWEEGTDSLLCEGRLAAVREWWLLLQADQDHQDEGALRELPESHHLHLRQSQGQEQQLVQVQDTHLE